MKRTVLGTTLLTLAAVAGCGADNTVGPTLPPDRPSFIVQGGIPSPDVNGNGKWCSRRVGHDDDPIASITTQSWVGLSIDDKDGDCPRGFVLQPRV